MTGGGRVHFVGIGGIGMSGLADILISRGTSVSGSDLKTNSITDKLEKKGALIKKGHHAANVPADTSLMVVSFCIDEANPEVQVAQEKGIPIIIRSELLKNVLSTADTSVVVTGTHGKTTTSALVASIMEFCGEDPTVIVGGEMERFGSNSKTGREDLIVAELDESDSFFRNDRVTHAIVTNLEREHMENYGTFENLLAAYTEFIMRIPETGMLAYNADDPALSGIVGGVKAKKIPFGMKYRKGIRYSCDDVTCAKVISFDLLRSGKAIARVENENVIGLHNVMNMTAAAGLCIEMGLDVDSVIEAISRFKNVRRRFDLVGEAGGVEIREDYAHHPTELSAVIKAAREYSDGRVIAVFQPHRHSRTNDLADEFVRCFEGADVLIATEIYSAHEKKTEGIGIKEILDRMDAKKFSLIKMLSKEKIAEYVSGIVEKNDVVLILGAGDIREISLPMLDLVKKKFAV
ncbi:MAG TPA: UDP-N-acetylmuramate--L-alanine ligase [Candidatus Omnitrophota bacterium]|nr:UDP-N-acetylmuramate--L-alanine ligase [Candidatus Omnitrophota bacterium]HPS20019.1 UDP-N-acetylmuramate--L-alanine ligase [Candidatus Omnitrophota bacterium]